MKTILEKLLSNLTTPSLQGRVRGGSVILFLLASMTASAQSVRLEKRMNSLINEYSEEFCTDKTINEMRDPYKPGRPLTSKCEMYCFTLKKKKDSYQRELLDEMLRAMETEGREDPNCYAFNSMSETSNGDIVGEKRRLMIGEDTENYIELGKDYNHFYNVNVIDTTDATKSHRYAYAVEWREKGKKIDVRYIVTYAKIPSATTTITQPSWPYIDFGRSRIPKDGPIQAPNKARAYNLGKENFTQQLDSLFKDAERRGEYSVQQLDSMFKNAERREEEALKKVNEALQRKEDSSLINKLLNNHSFLLNFYNLSNYYWKNKDTNLTAISIYQLCKLGRENDAFDNPESLEEWEQLMVDIDKLVEGAKNETDRKYFQMAREQLDKMKDKWK